MKNRKRTIAIALCLSLFSIFALPARTAAQQNSNLCTESRGKRIGKAAGTGAVLGGLIGAIVSKNNVGKGLGIGAAIGGGIGTVASVRKPAACSNPPGAVRNPYNASIADATEPTTSASDGPGVLLRNVYGADRTALEPILMADLPRRGYGLVDEDIYREQKGAVPVRYYLDVVIRQRAGVQGYSGGGFSRTAWSQWGNQSAGGDLYEVSVIMIDGQTGRPDPRRTATMSISATTYAAQNGSYTVANIYGYGSQSVWSNDPATGSAIAAINVFFGATPTP